MVRTVGQLRPVLARIAGATGVGNSSGVVLSYLNRALLELWHEGEWAGLCDRYVAPIVDGYLYLPDEFESVSLLTVSGEPTPIRSRDWELHAYGPGLQTATRISTVTPSLVDSGFVSLRGVFRAPNVVRVVTTETEDAEASIRFFGDGVETVLSLAGIPATFTDSRVLQSLDTRAGRLAKTPTVGVVEIRDGDDNLIDTLGPNTTLPQYRAYRLLGCSNEVTSVLVKARRAFRALTSDVDVVPISHIPALETMMLALRAKDNAAVAEYLGTKTMAVSQLAQYNATLEPRKDIGLQWEHAFGFDWEGV